MGAETKRFVINSWDWETIIEFDVSKYDHVKDRMVADTLIREEVFNLSLEHIKKNKLKVAVGLGIHEELLDEELIKYDKKSGLIETKDRRFMHIINKQLGVDSTNDSNFVESPSDLFLGRGQLFYTRIN